MKPHITDILEEFSYGVFYPIIAFHSLFYHPKWYRNPHPTKGTIIIVFCWFTPNTSHYKWVSYLEKNGYRTYLVNFPMLFEDFHTSAKKLEQFIIKRKIKNYTLVGISTGALVCLYFLHMFNKWSEVKKLISIGGPLGGTPAAWFICWFKKGRELLPGSQFIRILRSFPTPRKKIITILAQYDELVPKKYSVVSGNTSYTIPIWGHNRLHLNNKKTFDLIIKVLNEKHQ